MARPRRARVLIRGDKEIARRITQVRQARGLSQTELAAQMGVDQSDISCYERGTLRLHGRLIVQMAKILRVRADELLGTSPIRSIGEDAKSRRIVRRLRMIEQLPRRDQHVLLKVIDNYLAGTNGQRVA